MAVTQSPVFFFLIYWISNSTETTWPPCWRLRGTGRLCHVSCSGLRSHVLLSSRSGHFQPHTTFLWLMILAAKCKSLSTSTSRGCRTRPLCLLVLHIELEGWWPASPSWLSRSRPAPRPAPPAWRPAQPEPSGDLCWLWPDGSAALPGWPGRKEGTGKPGVLLVVGIRKKMGDGAVSPGFSLAYDKPTGEKVKWK